MTESHGPSAPINVILLLKEHLPGRYRELHAELKRLRSREQDIRAELSRMERHAAIEMIDLPPISGDEEKPEPLRLVAGEQTP